MFCKVTKLWKIYIDFMGRLKTKKKQTGKTYGD